MNTIQINAGGIDTHLVTKLEQLDTTQSRHIQLSNKAGKFSQAAKEQILSTLCQNIGLENITIDSVDHETLVQHIQQDLHNTLSFYAGDYQPHMSIQNKQLTQIQCYEESLAFIIGRYHWYQHIDQSHKALYMKSELAKYLQVDTTHTLVDTYLDDAQIKQESLTYISQLQPTTLKTIDNVITKKEDGITYVLIGQRRDYPKGSALLGGYIDYTRREPHALSDQEIAQNLGIDDPSFIAGLREGIEEASGKQESELDIIYYIEQRDGTPRCIGKDKHSNFTVGMRMDQVPYDYIERPEDLESLPSDARGPVATRARMMEVLVGTPVGSDDITGVERVAVDKLESIDFTMKHHEDIINNLLT